MATKTSFLGLTKPAYTDIADVAVFNSDLDIIEKALGARSRVFNLLDNSDFSNPVNARGGTNYTGGGTYTIDRWYITGSNKRVRVMGGYVRAETTVGSTYANICQRVAYASKLAGKTLTFAARVYSNVVPRIYAAIDNDGTLTVLGSTVSGTAAKYTILTSTFTVPSDVTDGKLVVMIQSASTAVGDYVNAYWAALYEGEYNSDTLPAYVPKGYTAELLECQRYYYAIPSDGNVSHPTFTGSTTQARVTIQTPVPMRINPTITVGAISNVKFYNPVKVYTATAVSVLSRSGNAISLGVTIGEEMSTPLGGVTRFNTTAALSADL